MGAEGAKMASNFEDVLISQASGQSKAYVIAHSLSYVIDFYQSITTYSGFLFTWELITRGETHYVGNFKRD